MAGHPAEDKGLAAIQRLVAQRGEAARQLVILADEPVPLQSIEGGCEVKLLPTGLPCEYIGWFRTADFTLVPDDPLTYANRTSGVFADGIATGSIPVTREGTWMADELRKYQLQELILDWEGQSLPEQLVTIKQSMRLRSSVETMRQLYGEIHGMPGYAKTLQQIFQREAELMKIALGYKWFPTAAGYHFERALRELNHDVTYVGLNTPERARLWRDDLDRCHCQASAATTRSLSVGRSCGVLLSRRESSCCRFQPLVI